MSVLITCVLIRCGILLGIISNAQLASSLSTLIKNANVSFQVGLDYVNVTVSVRDFRGICMQNKHSVWFHL